MHQVFFENGAGILTIVRCACPTEQAGLTLGPQGILKDESRGDVITPDDVAASLASYRASPQYQREKYRADLEACYAARRAAYLPVTDALDMIAKNQIAEYQALCMAVKAAYPKPVEPS